MPVFPIGDTSKLEKAFDTDCTGADSQSQHLFTTQLTNDQLIDRTFVPQFLHLNQFDSRFCQIFLIILIIIVIIGNQLIRLNNCLTNNSNNNISNNNNKRTDNKAIDKIWNNLSLNRFNKKNSFRDSTPMVEVDGRYNTVYNNMDNSEGYMEQEEEWEREGLLDPAWEKQQRKVTINYPFIYTFNSHQMFCLFCLFFFFFFFNFFFYAIIQMVCNFNASKLKQIISYLLFFFFILIMISFFFYC